MLSVAGLFFILASLVLTAQSQVNESSSAPLQPPLQLTPRSCIPLQRISFCSNLNYKNASIPNLRNQVDIQDISSVLQTFEPLVQIQCSNGIVHFLCSVFAPFCDIRHPEFRVRPCQSLCAHVRSTCEQILNQFGFNWPDYLECDMFPTQGDDPTCFGPPPDRLVDLQIPLDNDFQLICEEVMLADAPVIAINCRVEPPTAVVITCSIDGGDSFACGENFQVDLKLYAPGNHTIAVSVLFPVGRGIDRSIIFEGVGLEDAVNVSFVQPRRSVFEGAEYGAVEVCFNVLGRITEGKNYSVTIFGDPVQSPGVHQIIGINDMGMQCHTIYGVVASDGVLSDVTTNATFTLNLRSNSAPVRLVDPSSTTFIIIEEEIVLLNFTQPFYVVTESEGLDEVCVRLELPRGGVIRRPVTFRTHIVATGNRCGGNLPQEWFRPRIGYFNIGARDGDVWCLLVNVTDDEETEPPQRLQVELFISDVNVVPVRRVVNLTIIGDDHTTSTPTPPTSTRLPTPTQSPSPTEPPPALEAFFAGDTPRVEGDRLIMQVNTNKPASVICRINGTTATDCPPGHPITLGLIVPGTYAVRAIVTTTDERVVVESISVVVPSGNACSAHFINRGVTVEGSSARVEFSGAGLGDEAGFTCRLNNEQDKPCSSPLLLTDLESGVLRVRITPRCSIPVVTVARFTI